MIYHLTDGGPSLHNDERSSKNEEKILLNAVVEVIICNKEQKVKRRSFICDFVSCPLHAVNTGVCNHMLVVVFSMILSLDEFVLSKSRSCRVPMS